MNKLIIINYSFINNFKVIFINNFKIDTRLNYININILLK